MSKKLDLFVTVKLLEDAPAVLSLGKLCEDHGYSYHWTPGQNPQLSKKWQTNTMQHEKQRTGRCPWFIDWLFQVHPRLHLQHHCCSILNSQRHHEVRVRVAQHGKTRRQNQQKLETRIKMRTTRQHGETCFVTCQDHEKNVRKILSATEFQCAGTHARGLLVNQFQSCSEKWYR